MKYKFFIASLVALVFSGCSTKPEMKLKHLVLDIKKTNFNSGKLRDDAKLEFPISIRDMKFNRLSNVEKIKKCFPNALNKICTRSSREYIKGKELDIVELTISMEGFSTNVVGGAKEEYKELFLFIASVKASDIGYDYVVPVNETSSRSCTEYYETYGDRYSSSTFKNEICSSGGYMTYLLFSNPKDLEEGVFYGDEEIEPYYYLYSVGDTFGSIILPLQIEYSKNSLSLYVPENAYKNYYNSKKVVLALKDKMMSNRDWVVEHLKNDKNMKTSTLEKLKE